MMCSSNKEEGMSKSQDEHNQKIAKAAAKRGDLYLKLHNKGMSEIDIGLKYGVSRQRVNQILIKARNRASE